MKINRNESDLKIKCINKTRIINVQLHNLQLKFAPDSGGDSSFKMSNVAVSESSIRNLATLVPISAAKTFLTNFSMRNAADSELDAISSLRNIT